MHVIQGEPHKYTISTPAFTDAYGSRSHRGHQVWTWTVMRAGHYIQKGLVQDADQIDPVLKEHVCVLIV